MCTQYVEAAQQPDASPPPLQLAAAKLEAERELVVMLPLKP
jgi:hypothetical protein